MRKYFIFSCEYRPTQQKQALCLRMSNGLIRVYQTLDQSSAECLMPAQL